jgi:LmbE family N-acetylglucosaminyl deacetylase
MGIFAHPDDESLGNGGTFAKYSAEGVETSLITATRGQLGWFGEEDKNPGPEQLGRIREAELRAASGVLGVRDVSFLDYVDGQLDQADTPEIVEKIVANVRRVRPQVVITFDPQGAYGHPDHMAICQFATAAVLAAADPASRTTQQQSPHAVSKLYYMAWPKETWDIYQAAFGDLVMHIDGQERRAQSWEDWAITTRIDTSAYWQLVWEAVSCHKTQLPGYKGLLDLPKDQHEKLWGTQSYYRAYSLVNHGGRHEEDLFDGLR